MAYPIIIPGGSVWPESAFAPYAYAANWPIFWSEVITYLGASLSLPDQIAAKVSKAGDTMTGPLTIAGFGDRRFKIKSSDGTITTQFFSFDDLGGFVGTETNHPFYIRTNDGNRVTITASGDVGIGTTTPGTKLEVNGDIRGSGGFLSTSETGTAFLAPSTAVASSSFIARGSAAGYNDGGCEIFAGGLERVRVLNSGQVGIGKSAPTAILDIAGSGHAVGLSIGVDVQVGQKASTNHAVGNVGSVTLGIQDGGGFSGVSVNNTYSAPYCSQDIRFSTAEGGVTGTTERMRITKAGTVGIGTTSPGGTLELSNAAGTIARLRHGTDFSDIAQQASVLYISQQSNGSTSFWNGGSERANIKPDGKFGIGSAVPAALLDVNGSVALRSAGRTVANGLNSNIATPDAAKIRLTGATGAFSIGGLTGGVDGRIVTLRNTLSQTMTIVNEDASSTAGNRIKTLTGANIVLRATANSAVTLCYDATDARWIVESIN